MMFTSFRQIPTYIWVIISAIILTPVLFEFFLADKNLGTIWFIYLAAVILASYYSGLRGGLLIAILTVSIHLSWEVMTLVKFGSTSITSWILIPNVILQFLLAISIGFLADKLKEKHKELEDIFNSLDAAIWSHDLKNDNIIISAGVELIYGYTGSEFADDPSLWNKVVHPEDIDIVAEMNRNALLGYPTNTEFRIIRSDGQTRWVQDKSTPIFDKNNKLIRVNGVVFDITERKLAEEKIRKMAYYDYLTDLPNRKYTSQYFDYLVKKSPKENHKIFIIFIDLDGFKQVNDTLGHDAGDCLLKNVAERMTNLLRPADLLGRFGGDEFILLVDGLEEETVTQLAQLLMDTASKPYTINDQEVAITLSIGISMYPDDGTTYEELIKKADVSMYNSKGLGKNQHQFFRQHY